MTTKRQDQFTDATAISESDKVTGLQSGATRNFSVTQIREGVNNNDQTITGNVEVSGTHKAASYEGNGALITGVTAAGTGGTSSNASLSLVCSADGAVVGEKIVGSKDSQDLFEADENGFKVRTGIPYTHEDTNIPVDKSIDFQGKELIRNQTILDQQVWPYYSFTGTEYLFASDDPDLDVGVNNFALLGGFNTTDVPPIVGMIYEKRNAGTGAGINAFIDPNGKLNAVYNDGASSFTITSDTALNDGKDHYYDILGNRGGNLSMYVDGLLQADTEAINATNISNADNVYFGARGGSSLFYIGNIYRHRLFNRLLTDDEAISFSSNPQKAIDAADDGASQTAQTSGTLTIGYRYKIDTYVASDDFTNVGAASNATGVEFIATGTTPTTWTNSSSLRHIGCIAEWKGQGVGDNVWIETQNGNDAVNNGATPNNKQIFADVYCRNQLIVPRLTTTEKNALTAVNGMQVYDTTLNKFQGFEGGAWTSFI